jgi:hypothetical protein
LNKRILVVGIVAGVLLIAVPYFLILRGIASERRQQADLEEQIGILEMGLAGQQMGGSGVVAAREAELATAQAELAAAQFAFPSAVNSTDVLDYIISAAGSNSVNMLQVQARDPLTGAIGSGEYTVFAYDVDVEGELGAITAFIASLESGPIETLIVDQIRLEAQATPQPAYRARLVVQVYVRSRGSQGGNQ